MTYERLEFRTRAQRVFAPDGACAAAVKRAINGIIKNFEVSPGRARELLRGKALPSVKEMDKIRAMDGVWCPVEQKAKPPLLERMHDKIDDIYEFVAALKKRRQDRKLAKKPFIERVGGERV